jgi:hypothetical protein
MSPDLSEGPAHGLGVMDPRLMPSLGPVARAIDGIRIVCYVNMTVLDRMDFFCVHDMAIQFVFVGKHCSE